MNTHVKLAATRTILLMLLLLSSGCGDKKKKRKPIKLVDHYTILPLDYAGDRPEISTIHEIEVDAERIELTREYLRLHNNEFYRYLPVANEITSIRFQPQIVVVHYTSVPTLEEVIDTFTPNTIDGSRELIAKNGALNVGVQFVVDRDGTIYRLYPENVMSRHVIGLNHVAIGIENVGNADLDNAETGDKLPLTQEQLVANEKLIRYLGKNYSTLRYMIGHHEYRELEDRKHPAHHLFHEDVVGYRTEKQDPGPAFMRALRKRLKTKTQK